MKQGTYLEDYNKIKRNPTYTLVNMLAKTGISKKNLANFGVDVLTFPGLRGKKFFQIKSFYSWFDHPEVFQHKIEKKLLIKTSPYQISGDGLDFLSEIRKTGLNVEILKKDLYSKETVDVLIYE